MPFVQRLIIVTCIIAVFASTFFSEECSARTAGVGSQDTVTRGATEDSVEVPAKRDAIVYVMAELVGTSLGWVSGVVEVPVFRTDGSVYHELGVSAGIGSVQPLNGYVTAMVKYTLGSRHRFECGAGPSFLYKQWPAAKQSDSVPPQPLQIEPLSDAPVNVSTVLAYRYTADSGFMFRALLVSYFDIGQVRSLMYVWPTISIGIAV